jgi:hypothetical protein
VREARPPCQACRHAVLRTLVFFCMLVLVNGCALNGPFGGEGRVYPGQLPIEHPNYVDGLTGPPVGGRVADRPDVWLNRR